MDFIEYLTDHREEERLNNLVEVGIATAEEKKELNRLAEKNTKAFIYFKNVLDRYEILLDSRFDCGELDYSQLAKALHKIDNNTNIENYLRKL